MASLNQMVNNFIVNKSESIFGNITDFKRMEMSKENIEVLIYNLFSSAVSIFPIKDITVKFNTNKNTFKSIIPKQHVNSDFGEVTIAFTACCEGEEEERSEIYLYIPILKDGIYVRVTGNWYNGECQFIDRYPYVKGSKDNQRSLVIKTLSSPVEIIRKTMKRPKVKILNPNIEAFGEEPYETFWLLNIFKSQPRKLLLYMIPHMGLINTLRFLGVNPDDLTLGVVNDSSWLLNYDFSNTFANPFTDKTFFVDTAKKTKKKKIFIMIDKYGDFTEFQINVITNLIEALSEIQDVEELVKEEANPEYWYNKINNHDMNSKLSNPIEKFTNTTNGLLKLADSITLSISEDIIINEDGHTNGIFDIIIYCMKYFNHLVEISNNKKNFDVKRGRIAEFLLLPFLVSLNKKCNRLNITKRSRINNQTLIKQLGYRYPTVILDNIKSSSDNKSSSGVNSNANALDAFLKYTIRGGQGVASQAIESLDPDYMTFGYSELGLNSMYKSHTGGPGLKGVMASGVNVSDFHNTLQYNYGAIGSTPGLNQIKNGEDRYTVFDDYLEEFDKEDEDA